MTRIKQAVAQGWKDSRQVRSPMDYVLLAATALGGVALYLMLPREKASIAKLGMLMAVLAFGGLFLYMFRMLASGGAVSSVDPYFYVFAAIMVAGSIGVICQPKPVYAALYFVLVTLAGSGLFVMLLSEFMAIVLIIIYAGAILVTYVFVIMLASQSTSGTGGEATAPLYDREAAEPFAAVLISFILLGTILQCLYPPTADLKTAVADIRKQQDALVADLRVKSGGKSHEELIKTQQSIKESLVKLHDHRTLVRTLGVKKIDDTAGRMDEIKKHLADGNMKLSVSTAADVANDLARFEVNLDPQHADPRMVQRINEAISADGSIPQIPTTQFASTQSASTQPQKPMGDTQLLGNSLYGQYAISLELAGILLTIALIGAVVIARKEAPSPILGTGQVPNE